MPIPASATENVSIPLKMDRVTSTGFRDEHNVTEPENDRV